MIKYLPFLALMLTAFSAAAQTPQQMEMLRSRNEGYEVPAMTPEMMQQEMQRLQAEIDGKRQNADSAPVSVASQTDALGVNSLTLPPDLKPEEIKQLAKQVIEDKIILSLQNFQVVDGGLTPPTCSFDATVMNTTQVPLKRLFVFYKFGESETYADFGTVAPGGVIGTRIAMAGEACKIITSKPSMRVMNCELGNLSEAACKSRLMML